MEIDRAALMHVFLSDSEEDLARLEMNVLALEDRPDELSGVDAIFRAAHTLKGNAAMLSLDGIAKLAHRLEDVLDAVRGRRISITSELTTTILRAVDVLREMLGSLRAGQDDNPARHTDLEDELLACVGETKDGAGPAPMAQVAAAAPAPPEAGAALMVGNGGGPALRIEMARIDQLLDLASSALVVHGQMGVALLKSAEASEDVVELHQKNERLLMQLQDWVIEARMTPVSSFFRSLARTVRDAARAERKRVRLRVQDERVRVDTNIGESARDVLTHLVRNAIDHGIEAPALRAAHGKNPEGTITLSASQNGNQVVIQVSDDGAGFNLAKIRARALQLGRANADTLSAQALQQMVFEPGFSTAEKVTELSGRGVGMDVVRRSVEDLHGTVDIESVEGVGTTIELRLPLSLSVIEGFWVEVAGTEYVLPLDDVVECLEVSEDRRDLVESEGIIDLRGEPLACIHLRKLLETDFVTGGAWPIEQIVIVRHRSSLVGLGVDAIRGQRQTVIRPLGRLFRTLAAVSGSAIRSDGSVALVIDVARLLRSVTRAGAAPVVRDVRTDAGQIREGRSS